MISVLDAADAFDELKEMLAVESHPVLTDAQVARLLLGSAQKDAAGVIPGVAGWVGTYDLDAAAAEGWRRKAARVAGDYNFSDGDARLDRGAIIQNCLKMAAEYTKRIAPGTAMFRFITEISIQDQFEQDIRDGFRVFEGAWFTP